MGRISFVPAVSRLMEKVLHTEFAFVLPCGRRADIDGGGGISVVRTKLRSLLPTFTPYRFCYVFVGIAKLTP